MCAATSPPHLQPRSVPLGVLLGVLALHAVLLMLGTRLGVGRDRGPAQPSEAPMAAQLPAEASRQTAPAPAALNLTLPRAASAAWR